MNRQDLEQLWGWTLRSPHPSVEEFRRLAEAVVEVYASGDPQFTRHLQNRLKQIKERTGEDLNEKGFNLPTAHILIEDEIGFKNWEELISVIENQSETSRPLLFQYAVAAMERGNFSELETMVGGPERFDDQIIDWDEKGLFDDEQETLAEVFSAACMFGHPSAAAMFGQGDRLIPHLEFRILVVECPLIRGGVNEGRRNYKD